MDNQNSVGQSQNRSEVMSAFLMRMSEFFCPSDRELALRGQIKTGWSTVAARKKSRQSQSRLPPQDMKHIKEVMAQAEALQVAEEIRIGVQMLKLQRLRNSCRGNGTSSCILCGHDFAHHRSRSPTSLHFCHECAKAVCSRCKTDYKCHTGETVVLCRLCSDERELWKKSGAWLSNMLPVVNISEEELEKAQQQRQKQKVVVAPLRSDFMVSPSKLDDDEDSEDDLSSVSGSTANYGGFSHIGGSAASSRSASPDTSLMSEANPAAAGWKGDQSSSIELRPETYGSLPRAHQLTKKQSVSPMRKSGSYDLVAIRKQRSSPLPMQQERERSGSMVRKPAMSGDRKKDMEELRRRVVEKKKTAEQRRSLGTEEPVEMKRSRSGDLPTPSSQILPIKGSLPHPHIKVVKATPPTSPNVLLGGEDRTESPLTVKAVATEPVRNVPEPETQNKSPGVFNLPLDTAPEQQTGHSDSDMTPAASKKRKPVPSPRMKQNTSESEPTTTVTLQQQQQQQQQEQQEPEEFKRIVTSSVVVSSVEGKKYATLEREKKDRPVAMRRKRAGSLEKDKTRDYMSSTFEKQQRQAKTPEPQAFEFKKVASPAKKMSVGSSKPSVASPRFTAVLPSEVNKELEKELQSKQAPVEVSPAMEDEAKVNPKLNEIGKTSSITSEGSVESTKESADNVSGVDPAGSADHRWQRKGAKRVGGRSRRPPRSPQLEFEDEETAPRARSRSGAVSGGNASVAAMRRSPYNQEEEEPHSRSRTRSGAMSGGDAVVLRRSRNVKGSPRPASRETRHRPLAQLYSAPLTVGEDTDDYTTFQHTTDPDSFEEVACLRRERPRRAALSGSDLLVAADGEAD